MENSGPCGVCYPQTDCSRTYDTIAMQLSLERCGVVLLDRSRGGTAPGSQPQRSPTSATDCDSDPSGLTMDGQSRTNGQQALKIVQWNAEGVRLKKTELQHFLKLKTIDVCCIQETHLSSSHRFFIRGYEVFRQDQENRPKGGLLTLVRNNISPATEIQRSGQADLDTEYLGVKLVLARTPVTVFNIYSPPDKQIQLHNIKVEPQSWIITGDFNSHSPSWGYGQLNSKGEEVENWITENRLILINKPDDPDTFYSRTWRTTSTPDLAIATEDIQGIAEREVSSQLGGSDHRPVIISIKGQTQPHRNKLPASWNYKKANWDAFREAVDKKTAALELPETNISSSVALFNKAVLEAAKMFIPRGRRRDYQPYWTPELDNLHKVLDQAREKMESSPTNANVESHSKAKAQKHIGACSRAVLLKIFNHSWIKGVVPAVWKEAIVIPVPKKGKDKKNPRSYRHISLLSCVGKLLERITGDSSTTWRATMCYLRRRQATGSTEAQRTNLPTLRRTSKMHSRRKGRFWQSSSISQMHLTRSGKRDFL